MNTLFILTYAYLSESEILEIDDGTWTAVSSGTYSKSMRESYLFDGYISRIYHSNHGEAPYQWIQVNFGREIKVLFLATGHFINARQ